MAVANGTKFSRAFRSRIEARNLAVNASSSARRISSTPSNASDQALPGAPLAVPGGRPPLVV